MTPKEKARDLVDKMLIGFIDWTHLIPINKNINTTIFLEAKQRSIIAVDEVINNLKYPDYLDSEYWEEVKNEIEKL